MRNTRLALALLLAPAVHAAPDPIAPDPKGVAFFEQNIRPALVEHCYECHSAGAKKLKGALFLDSQAGWMKGGDSGSPVIVAGKPEDSLLLRSIRHLEADLEMPPKKAKLPEKVISDFELWIKMGAPDPRTQTTAEARRADKSWWSLQPLLKEFKHASIDGFIAEKLEEKKLGRSDRAKPGNLLRRLSYDLTGLPPTLPEVNAFTAAYQQNPKLATEELVDRLLASPRYGEKWGRHWLDVVRFGESNGFERNFIIDDLWPFRDYVIRSLNEDKPFDQFITEHLAGDVAGSGQPQIEVGSAFLVAGPYDDVGNKDLAAQKNIRAATLDDMITATSSAFLGLSVNCARCHNHKFDPIPTEDYYRLRAAFEGVVHGRRVVATPEQQTAFQEAMKPLTAEKNAAAAELEKCNKAVEEKALKLLANTTTVREKVDPTGTDERFAPVRAQFVKFVMTANSTNPKSAVGGRISEFEVWNDDALPRNVALARNGAKAEGAKSASAEDFPEAYSASLTIDGDDGAQWFIGSPTELLITLPRVETLTRISFRSAKGMTKVDSSQGAVPCEYSLWVSMDGNSWTQVADSRDREPWSKAHALERVRRDAISPEETARIAELEKRLADVERRIATVPKLPQMWVGTRNRKPEPTFSHKGGDPTKPVAPVVASSLKVLEGVAASYTLEVDTPEGERRVALAKWITKDNPITARVLANRIWHYHFGTGLVDTPSDFGFLGSKPTHPELLDYLAQRLIANGWKIKALHREIVLSETYLQSAEFNPAAAREDKDSRLLWRFPPRRLGAEEIRDSMLQSAGQLKLAPMGGPGFRLYRYLANNVSTYIPVDDQGAETFRRAVYHQNARASVVDILNDFDLPDIAFASPRRANTTTPLQALTLFNNGFTLKMASLLAETLGTDDPIASAYTRTLQRLPTDKERKAAEKLLDAHGTEALCRALLNTNEFIYLE